jgi:BirA family transcriptional regulator, biotin operon repressor / biotin---[acetyl-CoA-carboxylase] ligase
MAKKVAWRILTFERLRSTQDRALQMAAEGSPEGTVVVAREQTAGRGRRERSWISPKGGLYMSAVLRPKRKTRIASLQFLGALAVIDGIKRITRITSTLRWPNDIIIEGKKVGGVIAEASFLNRELSHVVMGIGVNVNFKASLLKGVSTESATLVDLAGANVDMDSLASAILESLGNHYALWSERKDGILNTRIRKSLSTLGERVTIGLASEKISGIAKSFNSNGSLIVGTGGKRVAIKTEDIEWLREIEPASSSPPKSVQRQAATKVLSSRSS